MENKFHTWIKKEIFQNFIEELDILIMLIKKIILLKNILIIIYD